MLRERLMRAVEQTVLSQEDFDAWDAARKEANACTKNTTVYTRGRLQGEEQTLLKSPPAELNSPDPAVQAARGARIEEGVEANLSVGRDTNAEVVALRKQVAEQGALLRAVAADCAAVRGVVVDSVVPDRTQGQTATARRGVVLDTVRKLHTERRELVPNCRRGARRQIRSRSRAPPDSPHVG